MKINKLKMIAAAVVIVVIALSLYMFFRPLEVSAVRVSRGEISSGVEEDGYVQPIDDRNLYATQNARIVEVPVEAGEEVLRGQILVRMTNPDLDAALAEVRAYSGQAEKSVSGYAAVVGSMRLLLADEKRTLDRSKTLFQAGAISRTELEQANLRVERIGKDLKEAEARLASASGLRKGLRDQLSELEKKSAELTVQSPIDGYVLNLPAKEDQVVAPGDLVVGLAVRNEMEIRADVLSDALGSVEVGQHVRITAPVLGGIALDGLVKKIYPLAEEKISPLGVEQRRVPVIITLPVTGVLRPGYEVRVFIVTARRIKTLILPVESVRTEDGSKKAFKITGGRVRVTAVKTGITDRRMVEILEGLEEGYIVVRDASLDIQEGQRIRVQDPD
ncbi:MAG: efflux RND transporter periplasmic adaptor subunit [Thermovirgaceae bacterium]|nr:efflux RND transporter periplasmic adaptor subunit [Thermovirgaceae bacterium]